MELWASLAGQWPILGVDPDSARRIRARAATWQLAPQAVALVDWLGSLLLFILPLLLLVLTRPGPHPAGRMLLFVALGGLLFIGLQRIIRFLGLLLVRRISGFKAP